MIRSIRGTPKGFTIVELLVVIVVIAILTSIGIVSYNGVQRRAKNTAHMVELKAWEKQFEDYRIANGSFPLPTVMNGGYCLGTGFPTLSSSIGPQCRYLSTHSSYYPEGGNTALMSALKTVGALPSGDRTPIGDWVGPYLDYQPTTITLSMIIYGTSAGECPTGTTGLIWDNSGALECSIVLQR